MMKYIRVSVLGLLLLVALSLCGTLVLKVFDIILHIGFENIWLAGFKVGCVACILLLCDYIRRKRWKQEEV